MNGLLMSLENSDSESVRSSASVTAPLPTVGDDVCDVICGFLVDDGDCGRCVVDDEPDPNGGFAHAFGGGVGALAGC